MPRIFPVQMPSGRLEDQPHLSPAELATRLHISRKTVYRRIESGTWPYTRVESKVYFSPADIAYIMAGSKHTPAAMMDGAES